MDDIELALTNEPRHTAAPFPQPCVGRGFSRQNASKCQKFVVIKPKCIELSDCEMTQKLERDLVYRVSEVNLSGEVISEDGKG